MISLFGWVRFCLETQILISNNFSAMASFLSEAKLRHLNKWSRMYKQVNPRGDGPSDSKSIYSEVSLISETISRISIRIVIPRVSCFIWMELISKLVIQLYSVCLKIIFELLLINWLPSVSSSYIKFSGVGRGCSASFLTDDQHLHLGLGAHSRPSHVGEYLPHDFDQVKHPISSVDTYIFFSLT